jgi:succinoglycan biosynthesis protein ExoM
MLISVCLCTYKRETLRKTLDSLVKQQLPADVQLEVVVVDNDAEASGRAIAESFSDLDINYQVCTERNLSAVRNATIEAAKGELIAFIDDDEWAEPNWIASLYAAMDRYQADAVFGYVDVQYPSDAPDWIVAGHMFRKDHCKTGTVLTKGATSNALLKAKWVRDNNLRFDPVFGKSGGEDTDFFHRIYKAGGKLVFENDAIVSEVVESHRLNLDYLKKQNVRIGQTHWSYLWSKQSGLAFWKTAAFVVAQVVASAILYVVNLPFGKNRYARWYLLLVRNLVKLKTAWAGESQPVELYGNH